MPLRYPIRDDVHGRHDFVFIEFGRKDGRIVADAVVEMLFQFAVTAAGKGGLLSWNVCHTDVRAEVFSFPATEFGGCGGGRELP